MIYGFTLTDPKNELVIVAGDSLDEQQSFLASAQDRVQDTDFTRFLMDPLFKDYKKSPTILEFDTLNDMHEFIATNGVNVISARAGPNQQSRMLLNEEFSTSDQRTIAEIHGITDENDPWSRRTDEQKAAAIARKQQMKKKAEAGEFTGDSYGGGEKPEGKKEGDLNIRDVKIKVNDDGSVDFGPILAEKGVWNRPRYHVVIRDGDIPAYVDLVKRAGLMNENDTPAEWEKHPQEGIVITTTTAGGERIRQALDGVDCTITVLEDEEPVVVSDDWKIADDDLVSIYFRVDAPSMAIATLQPILDEADARPFLKRDVEGFGCWMAFVREKSASACLTALLENGVQAVLVEVDRNGDRIVEEGADAIVVDTGAEEEEPPLPWNDRAAEFAQMSEDEQRKTLTGKYLLYTIRDYGLPHGRIIHIAPKSVFKSSGRIWEGELPIRHLLAPGIEKMGDGPGLYQCKSLDLNATDFMLGNKAEMIESLNLRMWANLLPDGDQNAYDRKAG